MLNDASVGTGVHTDNVQHVGTVFHTDMVM